MTKLASVVVAKHREVLFVGRLLDGLDKEIVALVRSGGRLPNEHKIPVRLWTIRETPIIPSTARRLFEGISDDGLTDAPAAGTSHR
jgi:hypothetical protein